MFHNTVFRYVILQHGKISIIVVLNKLKKTRKVIQLRCI